MGDLRTMVNAVQQELKHHAYKLIFINIHRKHKMYFRKIKNSSNEPLLIEKIIRIPLWKTWKILFDLFIPWFFVLFIIGILIIYDGIFDTNLFKPGLGMISVILGIIFMVPFCLVIRRIIKYPGIIFTKDYVIIPPVKIYHWRKKIIHYNKIKKIELGGLKFDYRILYDNNKWINFPKHNGKNKLWNEFNRELYKRQSKALKEFKKYKKT